MPSYSFISYLRMAPSPLGALVLLLNVLCVSIKYICWSQQLCWYSNKQMPIFLAHTATLKIQLLYFFGISTKGSEYMVLFYLYAHVFCLIKCTVCFYKFVGVSSCVECWYASHKMPIFDAGPRPMKNVGNMDVIFSILRCLRSIRPPPWVQNIYGIIKYLICLYYFCPQRQHTKFSWCTLSCMYLPTCAVKKRFFVLASSWMFVWSVNRRLMTSFFVGVV
eukprot:GEMP01035204.1.p1 GENE.GEMP01035204.1~~GEMP01035204.1.p1  ORF type:complete len:220 (+),score=-30.05 GEMP01035204.1:289-948(+)